MTNSDGADDWDGLLTAVVEFQTAHGDYPLLGGTAAALYAGHRRSNDADYGVSDLAERFDELLRELDADDRWDLQRRHHGRLLLGRFEGVQTGLRQLRRTRPLATEQRHTSAGRVTVPTLPELVRVKGWLIIDRNVTRDYLDFAALSATLDDMTLEHALSLFNDCYRDVARDGSDRATNPLMQLQWQLDAPHPDDLEETPPSSYRGIQPPWDDWAVIADQCERTARIIDPLVADA